MPIRYEKISKTTFSKALKNWRKSRGETFTQQNAADEFGVAVYTIRSWEQQKSIPDGIAYQTVMNRLFPSGLPIGGLTNTEEGGAES